MPLGEKEQSRESLSADLLLFVQAGESYFARYGRQAAFVDGFLPA
jgi:hypothetical protein